MAPAGRTLESVIPELVSYLKGMFIWGHPQSQVNVVPPPSIASIIGVLLPATYNPNLVQRGEQPPRLPRPKCACASMAADLVGYDPQAAGGVFTFGGTGALLYGVKIGLEKALPGSLQRGVREDAVVLASRAEPLRVLNVAGWLGIGQDQVISVPTAPGQLDRRGGARGSAPAAARGGPARSRRSWPRWARPTPSASTTWPAIRAVRDRLVAASISWTTGRTSTPTP